MQSRKYSQSGQRLKDSAQFTKPRQSKLHSLSAELRSTTISRLSKEMREKSTSPTSLPVLAKCTLSTTQWPDTSISRALTTLICSQKFLSQELLSPCNRLTLLRKMRLTLKTAFHLPATRSRSQIFRTSGDMTQTSGALCKHPWTRAANLGSPTMLISSTLEWAQTQDRRLMIVKCTTKQAAVSKQRNYTTVTIKSTSSETIRLGQWWSSLPSKFLQTVIRTELLRRQRLSMQRN